MTIYKKSFGKQGEDHAVEYLQNQNFRILTRNFRTRYGEIDIIAVKNSKVFFVEVKTRSSIDKGRPYEAITVQKRHRMRLMADYFLMQSNYTRYKYTLSVIAIIYQDNETYSLDFFENIDF